jgi:hypothetical protein
VPLLWPFDELGAIAAVVPEAETFADGRRPPSGASGGALAMRLPKPSMAFA